MWAGDFCRQNGAVESFGVQIKDDDDDKKKEQERGSFACRDRSEKKKVGIRVS